MHEQDGRQCDPHLRLRKLEPAYQAVMITTIRRAQPTHLGQVLGQGGALLFLKEGKARQQQGLAVALHVAHVLHALGVAVY